MRLSSQSYLSYNIFATQLHVYMDSFGLGNTFQITALYKHELVSG